MSVFPLFKINKYRWNKFIECYRNRRQQRVGVLQSLHGAIQFFDKNFTFVGE